MTLRQPYIIDCPSCGKKFGAVLWDSINTSVNPEGVKLLFESKINLVFCPSCGLRFFVNKPVLVHHPEMKFFLWIVPEQENYRNSEHLKKESDLIIKELLSNAEPQDEFDIIPGYICNVISWRTFSWLLMNSKEGRDLPPDEKLHELISEAVDRWPASLERMLGIEGADVVIYPGEDIKRKGVWLSLNDDPDLPHVFFWEERNFMRKH